MDLFFDNEFRTLISPLQLEEYQQLEESLIKEGNRDPIVVWKETRLLLDGHNRYDICHKHNIPLKPPAELSLPDHDSAKIWIIKNQLGRRNIPPYVRSVLALKLEDLISTKAKKNLITSTGGKNPQPLPTLAKATIDTRKEIAKLAHVAHGTLDKVKIIEQEASSKQKDRLISGNATIHEIFVEVRRAKIKEQIKQTAWPTGKYRLIYADPPWKYNNTMPDEFVEQSDHYPLMPLKEICELPVPDLLEDNAVLFLWTTSPMLEESFQVINSWGFKYKASFVWDKVKHNLGHYNSIRHEFLLIAVKGSCQPDVIKLFDSVQTIERDGHSAKPEFFREIINTLYPYGPRIELFARKKVEGWECYGNQNTS